MINLTVRNVAATCACRKHTFVVATGQTSRAPRKCGQPISASFSAELSRTNALQTSLDLISAASIASHKSRYNERVSSASRTRV